MKNRGLLLGIAMLLAVLLAATPAAALVAWEFTTPVAENTGNNSDFLWTLGTEFTVLTLPIQVTQLGFFDYLGNGLAGSHDVAIWDVSNPTTPLTQATVPSGTSAPLSGHFRYVATTPVTLTVGTSYRIGTFAAVDYYTYDPTGFYTDALVKYDNEAYKSSTGLVYPSDTDYAVTGYFGANFKGNAVPVPPSLVLLGSGLLGLLGLGYFRKKA